MPHAHYAFLRPEIDLAACVQYIVEDKLCLMAEWSDAALAEFDEAAWTSPHVHESASERLMAGAPALLSLVPWELSLTECTPAPVGIYSGRTQLQRILRPKV